MQNIPINVSHVDVDKDPRVVEAVRAQVRRVFEGIQPVVLPCPPVPVPLPRP